MVVLKLKNVNLLIGKQWQSTKDYVHIMAFCVALD